MLKEIGIILGEIGCIFLMLVIFGSSMYSSGISVEFIVILPLFAVLLVYSSFHIKKLLDNKQGRGAVCFSFIQAVTIILSFFVVSWVITNGILFGV